MKRASTRLRELIARGPTLYVPGCYNAMSAKVLEQAGFDAIYMTGYGTSLSLTGLPDVGLATMTEMVANARYIASAVRIPLVADADTGFGNAINVVRSVEEYIRSGLAGMHLEDQVAPKRCGHVAGREVVDRAEAIGKPVFDLLETRKKAGFFRGFWRTAEEAAELMVKEQTDIQSMWSTGIGILNGAGLPVEQSVPAEGYRAWHGGLCLSRGLEGRMLDVAYDYLNWWISGWPGAVVARQGYYISTPHRTRRHMTEAEWDYWYRGLAAAEDLPGPDGSIRIKAGSVRSGGSYWQRANSIALWNTTMDEHNYLVRRWMQLVGRN